MSASAEGSPTTPGGAGESHPSISPMEIEKVLNGHLAVAESVVLIRPTRSGGGPELHAFVVLRPGASAGEYALREHCRAHLPPHEVPTRIHFRDSLPRSPVGKLLRRSLEAELLEQGH